jgi:hypothetical protein
MTNVIKRKFCLGIERCGISRDVGEACESEMAGSRGAAVGSPSGLSGPTTVLVWKGSAAAVLLAGSSELGLGVSLDGHGAPWGLIDNKSPGLRALRFLWN